MPAVPSPASGGLLRGIGAAAILFLVAVQPARSAPADTLGELHGTLRACSRLRSAPRAWAGSELTVRFSIASDGRLLGRPRITYSRLPAEREEHEPFVAAALSALGSCFPLDITPGLGGAVAGRPIALRIGVAGAATATMPRL